jgi:hypothetical protein
MRKLMAFAASLAIASLATAPLLQTNARAQESQSPLTVTDGDSHIHIFPTIHGATALAPLVVDTGPLDYHGGPIMQSVTTFAIFWIPAALQNGAPTGMSPTYRPILKRLLTDYPGHGINNNSTQYSQVIGTTTYIHNAGKFGGAFLDTSPYPASGCADPATPGNCLTDAQIRKEIKRVIALNGWPVGFSHMFLLFTSKGEGSCINSSNANCAYAPPGGYCGYHGHIGAVATTAIIYSNEPYGEPSACQVPLAPSPNGDPAADDAATVASHELTEATTDPLLNAWFTSMGNEIGDLCAYNYGPLAWDSSAANEMWNGNFYLLQQEFDNHVGDCVQVGP